MKSSMKLEDSINIYQTHKCAMLFGIRIKMYVFAMMVVLDKICVRSLPLKISPTRAVAENTSDTAPLR